MNELLLLLLLLVGWRSLFSTLTQTNKTFGSVKFLGTVNGMSGCIWQTICLRWRPSRRLMRWRTPNHCSDSTGLPEEHSGSR